MNFDKVIRCTKYPENESKCFFRDANFSKNLKIIKMRLKLIELALIIGIYGFKSLDRSVNPECKDLDSKIPFIHCINIQIQIVFKLHLNVASIVSKLISLLVNIHVN